MQTMDKGKSGENSEMPRAERALQEIRRDILSMAFAPGEPVSERALEEHRDLGQSAVQPTHRLQVPLSPRRRLRGVQQRVHFLSTRR